MQKNPPYEKWKAGTQGKEDIARKTLGALSASLQGKLCAGLCAEDKSWFDATLNSLEMDEATRAVILKEVLRDAPALRPPESDRVVARCFRRKVNALRCIGRGVLLSVMHNLRPGVVAGEAEGKDGERGPVPGLSASEVIARARAAKLQRRAARRKAAGGGQAATATTDPSTALTSADAAASCGAPAVATALGVGPLPPSADVLEAEVGVGVLGRSDSAPDGASCSSGAAVREGIAIGGAVAPGSDEHVQRDATDPPPSCDPPAAKRPKRDG
mmetsp:Transcript_61241/g.169505  ORF Transcript_61241/g.169505 Transcript_61241/m.169505 type:complete len:272 (-) Transcript_61241:25-840(-)